MRLHKLLRDDELHARTHAERIGERVLRPFHQFARWQASGALLLLASAVGALVWANSPWGLRGSQWASGGASGQRGQKRGDDLELQVLLVPIAIGASLQHADFVVEPLDHAQADLFFGLQ